MSNPSQPEPDAPEAADAPEQPGGEQWAGSSAPPPGYAPPGYGAPGYGAPGYAPPPGYGQAPYGQPAPPRTNPLAIASLVCSLAGLVTGISVIAGIVLGHIALNQIKQTGEEGRTLAVAGLAVGYGLLVIGTLILILFFGLFAIFGTVVSTTSATGGF